MSVKPPRPSNLCSARTTLTAIGLNCSRCKVRQAAGAEGLAVYDRLEPVHLHDRQIRKLLAHALPQPAELRPELLAAEFPLEAGDRVDGRVGTQTSQTFRVSRTRALRLDRRGLRFRSCSNLGTGLWPADRVSRDAAAKGNCRRRQPCVGPLAVAPPRLSIDHLQVDRARQQADDIVLELLDVSSLQIEAFGPQVTTGFRVNKLGIDSNEITIRKYAASEHIADIQLAADLTSRLRPCPCT